MARMDIGEEKEAGRRQWLHVRALCHFDLVQDFIRKPFPRWIIRSIFDASPWYDGCELESITAWDKSRAGWPSCVGGIRKLRCLLSQPRLPGHWSLAGCGREFISRA